MVSGAQPKLLEIDARLPSQTPTAVYWSSGLNIVELLAETVRREAPPVVDRTARRACVYQHVRAARGMLEVLGEHVMGSAGPLRLVPGFFGADEALTDYEPGRAEWAATLIVAADERARGARPRRRRGRRTGAVRRPAGRTRRRADGRERGRPTMTRLTEADVTTLTRDLEAFEARLLEATGLDLRGLALRTVTDGDRCVQLRGARIAAVPMSSGEGVIPGFSACVVATLLHLGCDAWMTTQPDVRGMQAAVAGGATVLFLADDHRFIALSLDKACSVDDDHGDGGRLRDRAGGRRRRPRRPRGAAARPRPGGPRRRAQTGGATAPSCWSRSRTRSASPRPRDVGLVFEVVDLAAGLGRCDLVFDASPGRRHHRRGRTCARRRSPRCPACRPRSPRRRRRPSACATSTSRSPSASRSWRRAPCSDASPPARRRSRRAPVYNRVARGVDRKDQRGL